MTLEQLRIFVAAAEREHVTQTAHDLHLTQSAVSAAIAALESRHAVKLFDRVGRRIALTAAGHVFLNEARAVLMRANDAEMALADLTGLKRGALTVAASQTIGNYWLPPRALAYRRAYPGIMLHVRIGTTPEVAAWICAGEADVGLVEADVDAPLLTSTAMPGDELVIITSPAVSLPKKSKVIDWLQQAPWVLREKGSATRAIFERALKSAGLTLKDLNVVLELPSNEAVRTACIAGAGAAALSRLVVTKLLQSGSLSQIDFAMPKRRFFSLRHCERAPTHAAREFTALLKDQTTRKF